jgi:hypothetical protein
MSEPLGVKPHLTKLYGRWVIMWHRKSECFIWSNPIDFVDACRYLRLVHNIPWGKYYTTAPRSAR